MTTDVVGAGVLQLETGFMLESIPGTSVVHAPVPRLRGLTKRLELPIGGDGVLWQAPSSASALGHASGLSDMGIKLKWKLLDEHHGAGNHVEHGAVPRHRKERANRPRGRALFRFGGAALVPGGGTCDPASRGALGKVTRALVLYRRPPHGAGALQSVQAVSAKALAAGEPPAVRPKAST